MYDSGTAKIREKALPYCEGPGIDIGCRAHKIKKENCIGIDLKNYKDVDHVLDASKQLPFRPHQFNYVYSSHCLEDIEDTETTLMEWSRILKPGGYMVLYLPHRDLYKEHNPEHKHDFISDDITPILIKLGYGIVENIVDEGEDKYSFFVVAKKICTCVRCT